MSTYIKENREAIKRFVRWSCFGILLIIASMSIFALSMEKLQNGTAVTQRIYDYNCTLCVVSIGLHILYLFANYLGKSKKEILNSIKDFFKKEWQCLLLVIFMAWTAVGCLGAAIEADAEAQIREAYSTYQKTGDIADLEVVRDELKIAMWSSGDRANNAADRAWNGCKNLKDGYFSFLFYATVVVDVILLGHNSKNIKKWILRVMMLVMILIAFLTMLNYFNSDFMKDCMPYRRAIFHNSNHYGYYLCIGVILSATMFVKEKNLYFKVLSFVGFLITMFILILNNTFGAYLGVLVALIALLVHALVRCFTTMRISEENEELTDGTKSKEEKTRNQKEKEESISTLVKAFVMVVILGIASFTVCEGASRKPIVVRNFEVMFKDVGIWLDESEESKQMPSISGENQEKEETTTEKNNEAIANTGSGRGKVWLGVFHLVKQKPFFGWGLENLLQAFYDQLDINEGRTHNLILQLMGTTGVPGMLFYIIAVMGIFLRTILKDEMKKVGNYIKKFVYTIIATIILVVATNFPRVLLIFLILELVLFMLYLLIAIIRAMSKEKYYLNETEYITAFCFISYMISSLFGNSAFYTSPYFMIILGMLITADWNNKKEIDSKKDKKHIK